MTRKTSKPAKQEPDKALVQAEVRALQKRLIVERISRGETLLAICRSNDIPSAPVIYRWINEDSEFAAEMDRARELGADAIADECLAIADETSRDTIETENGPKADAEWIARSKLRVETRLKLLAKWHPKKYGDKVSHDVDVTNTVVIKDFSGRGNVPAPALDIPSVVEVERDET